MLIFWKQIGLVVQIAIVVSAVLLFSFFDPFNLLKSKKLNLEHTPINVKSIQEIGQLITAEYYGEVLNSLQQSRINQVIDENVDYEEEYMSIHTQYRNAINELINDKDSYRISRWNKKNDLYDYFYFRFNRLTANPYYQDYIDWLLLQMKEKTEKQLLKRFYTDSTKELDELNKITNSTSLKDSLKTISEKKVNTLSADRKFRKQQIVVLGRGWVKAGIDFGKFTQNNFKYDKAAKTIHLVGMKPEIISCSINPWFIPEKQVKGFEVILISHKANRPKYMQIVKTETLKKLRNNALEANILEKARKNAETNLKIFFSLLLEDDLDKVIIHDDFFSYFDVSMAQESLTPDAMKSIDSLFIRRFNEDSVEVVSMRDSIKNSSQIIIGSIGYKVQRFSSLLSLIEDEELSMGELSKIESIQKSIHSDLEILEAENTNIQHNQLGLSVLDTIWYFPDNNTSLSIYQAVEQELKPKKPFSTWKIISGDEEYLALESKRITEYHRRVWHYMAEQKMMDYTSIVDQLKGNVSQLVLGDATFVTSQPKQIKNASGTSLKLEDQKIVFTNDIRIRINEELLSKSTTSIASDSIEILSDSLSYNLVPEKPYLIIPKRDSIQEKYVYCMSLDCYPMSRYTYLLTNTASDSLIQTAWDSISIEENNISSDRDSLLKSEKSYHINLQDSVWFYPSEFTLEVLKKERDNVYPTGNFRGFFRKAFSNRKQEEWTRQRISYYHMLVYKSMLDKKAEELEKAKSFLILEIDHHIRNSNAAKLSLGKQ